MNMQHPYAMAITDALTRISEKVGYKVALYRFWNGHLYKFCADERCTSGIFYPANSGDTANNKGYYYYIILADKHEAVVEHNLIQQQFEPYTAKFFISLFHGCCAFCITYNNFIGSNARNKGINKDLITIKEQLALLAGYTGLVCTTNTKDVRTLSTLAHTGFKELYTTINRRTNNTVKMFIKYLTA